MSLFYKLYGGLGSPYSMKMRAVLRYRQIPHIWISTYPAVGDALKKVKVPVIPVLEYPDGHCANDSTPLIFDLEERYTKRAIVPDDPALAFLACLIEDMADEWGTKIMFEYRWRAPVDQEVVSRRLAYDMAPGQGARETQGRADKFMVRQVGRMDLVGCTQANRPVIEQSYAMLLDALEGRLAESAFLFGSRPSLADFALYGQLRQLTDDPTARDFTNQRAPYTARWVENIDDASGIEGLWDPDPLEALSPLLVLAGQVYLPFLAANAKAVALSADTVQANLLGKPFAQAPFKYQVKCYTALKNRYSALPAGDKARLEPALSSAGILAYL